MGAGVLGERLHRLDFEAHVVAERLAAQRGQQHGDAVPVEVEPNLHALRHRQAAQMGRLCGGQRRRAASETRSSREVDGQVVVDAAIADLGYELPTNSEPSNHVLKPGQNHGDNLSRNKEAL